MDRSDEVLTSLRRVNRGLSSVVETTTRTVLDHSAAPELMEIAYAAIDGTVPGEEGRFALQLALGAEGMDSEVIDMIDVLYVRCLLDPTL